MTLRQPALYLLVSLLLAGLSLAAGTEHWRAKSALLYSMAHDGTLALDLPLWTLEIDGEIEIALTLKHELTVGADGNATSRFIVPQLWSTLVPGPAGGKSWRKPGGYILKFFPRSSEWAGPAGHKFLDRGQEQYSITTPTGCRYDYRNGVLERFSFESGLCFEVTATGGYLRQLDRRREGATENLVSVVYTSSRITGLFIERVERFVFEYATSGELCCIRDAEGAAVYRFEYVTGLLKSMVLTDGSAVNYTWQPYDDFRRADRSYRPPVRLASDGIYSYDYRIEGDWAVAVARDRTGQTTKNLYNRRTGRVQQQLSDVGGEWLE